MSHKRIFTIPLFLTLLVVLLSSVGGAILPAQAAPAMIPAAQESADISLEASADTYMNSGSTKGRYNYGGATTIQANPYYKSGGDDQYRGLLLKWDVSSIPASATVSAASITFYVTDSSTYAYNLYNLRREWVEGTNDGSTGSGASWNYYGAGTGSWGTTGAQNTSSDRYDTNLWDATTSTFGSTGSVTIPLNASGVAVVQEWIAGTSSNYGLTMQNYSGSAGDAWIVASKENTSYAGPTLNITYSNTTPTITTSGTLNAFSSSPGTPSTEQSYTVSGGNLTEAIVITPPTDFELSLTSESGFSSSPISLTPDSGTVASTTIYVRFNRATAGTSSGNIEHTSSGATIQNVAVSGTALPPTTWAAYNDSAWNSGEPDTNITQISIYDTTSGTLVKRSDGSTTSVTAAFTLSEPSVEGDDFQTTSAGAAAASGTDAYNVFNGNVSTAGVVNGMGSYSGWWIDLTLSGLDPAQTYTFAGTSIRNSSNYTTRNSTFILSGDDAAANASSSGVTVVDDHTIAFNTGYNSQGYIVRWVGIDPGDDGIIVIRARASTTAEIADSIDNAYGLSVFMLAEEVGAAPTIITSGALTPFSSVPGIPSAEQSYTVSGLNLTDNITITPPADFEISLTSGSGFVANPDTLTLTPSSGTVAATTIYVRFNRAEEGTSSDNITHTSAGATTRNVAVSGTAQIPLEAWTAYNDCAWASGQADTNITTYTIPDDGTATGLLKDYETGRDTPATVTFSASGSPGVQTGTYGGSETDPGTEAYLAFHGIADMPGVIQYGDSGWWVDVTFTGLDPAKTYSFVTSANRDGDYTDRITRFTLSDATTAINTSSSGVTRTTTIFTEDTSAFNTGNNTETGYVASWTGIQPGSDGDFTVRAEADTSVRQAYAFSVFKLQEESTDPTITLLGVPLNAFSSTPEVASGAQTYTVSGYNLIDNIVITAPTGFELSTNGTDYYNSLTLTRSGGSVSATTIYVRLYSATQGIFGGNIVHTSSDATQKNVAVSGTVAYTATFQYEASGYVGTVDTFIRGTTEGDMNFSAETGLEWDDNDGTTTDEIALIRFTGIFSSEGGPIPDGATIASATLTYMTTDLSSGSTAEGDPANVYESLVDWDGTTVTYNNFGGDAGVQSDEYNSTLIASAIAEATSTAYTIDVTASLQRWSDGTANYGWIFMPTDDDGVTIYSSDDATVAYRPRLSVSYYSGAVTTYTLSVDNDGNGTVMLTPAGGAYVAGTVVKLTPVPNSGYEFLGWNGANDTDLIDNGDGAWSIVMNGDKSVTARFTVLTTNVAPNQPVLGQPLDNAIGVSTTPTLQVTASDPNLADTLSVSFYGRANGGDAGEDFTLIAIPDTQNEVQSYSSVFYSQMQWIADNRTSENIVFAPSLGDIVNTANSEAQWQTADTGYDYLDIGNVAYSVGPGNHDLPLYSSPSLYSTYFGFSRFSGKSYYGGAYDESNNYDNYSLFSASGNDFILITLRYSADTEQLAWADALLKANTNRRGIVVQHDILNTNDTFYNQETYDALKDNPNLFLMLCGHMHASSDGAAYRAELGDDGHTIHIVLADYQDFANGGNGWLRILRFSPADDMIYMTTYSPYTGGSITTDPDQKNLVYDLAGNGATYALIGTVNGVTNGDSASIPWPDLAANTEYEWYAVASDGSLSTTGPTWSFTTGAATSNPPVITEGDSTSVTMSEDSSPTAFDLTLHATDADVSDTLTWSISTPASHGTATASGTGTSKTIGYTPATNYNGSDSFVVQVSDGSLTDIIIVNVTITAINDAPVCSDIAQTTTENTPVEFDPVCTDVDNLTLIYEIVTPAEHGTASVNETKLSYDPNDYYSGNDTFTYRASDSELTSNLATVNMTITQVTVCYLLTLGHTGNGSDPVASPANSAGCPAGEYVADASIILNAFPETGWHISSWSGTVDDTSAASTNTVTMPASAHAAGVTYVQEEYSLTVNVEGDGSVSKEPDQATYHYGEIVTLATTAAPGSTFFGWTGPNVTDLHDNGDGTWSITMDEAKGVTAIFEADQYEVTVTIVGNGTVSNSPGNPYSYNSTATLTPVAAANWTFSGWSGPDAAALSDNGDGTWSITVDSDKAVTATFTAESAGMLGDVDNDGLVNSTDALIVLSCDADIDTSPYCPMNCGDVNADELVNSTDALIILSYDAGMTVPFSVGQPGCPANVTPGPGCIP